MKRIALYAGTFDPVTNGHLWLIETAAKQYDEVIVSASVNAGKNPIFSLEERIEMLRTATLHIQNIRIEVCTGEYIAKFAKRLGATVLLRGIRNTTDFEYEKLIMDVNQKLEPTLETVYFISPAHMRDVQSGVVRELIGPKGWEFLVSEYVPPIVLQKLIAKNHTLWEELQKRGGQGDKIKFWNDVLSPYFEQNRFYHSWKHILHMLEEYEEVKQLLADPSLVKHAIWMHDSVYNTQSHGNKNEEDSARNAYSHAIRFHLGEEYAKELKSLVSLTDHVGFPISTDGRYLVDIDLAILGAEPTIFDEYEESVRKEYEWVPIDVFKTERAKILRSFLERESIYHTEYFQAKYEEVARKNLQRSLQNLES